MEIEGKAFAKGFNLSVDVCLMQMSMKTPCEMVTLEEIWIHEETSSST